MMGYCMMG